MKGILQSAILISDLGLYSAAGLVVLLFGLVLITIKTLSRTNTEKYQQQARIILD